jgi:hypothetical protein
MVMTIIMHDAVAALGKAPSQAYKDNHLFDVLYADDTLLLGMDAANVQALAEAVEQIGGTYGMALHWGKTQALSICTPDKIASPDGSPIDDKGSLKYLGATIYADGRADYEISRKIGIARADFNQLQKLWVMLTYLSRIG